MFLKIIGAICETLYGLLKAFALVGILRALLFSYNKSKNSIRKRKKWQ